MIKPIYEFLLWENCRNKCSFCFQQNKNQFDVEYKIKSLNKAIEFINDPVKFSPGSHVLFVGGEIFDSPEIRNNLKELLLFVLDKLNHKYIDLLYLNTNLIYKDLSSLYDWLSLISSNKLSNRLKFTTSWDISGRFSNKKLENLMLNNLKRIKSDFPDINIVVNTMLTRPMCHSILSERYKIRDFMSEYNCDVNLLPYIIYDSELAPDREEVLKALMTVNKQDSVYIDRYVRNFDLDQPKYLYQFDGNNLNYVSCGYNTCGHSVNFLRYSKSNSNCFICDIKNLFSV